MWILTMPQGDDKSHYHNTSDGELVTCLPLARLGLDCFPLQDKADAESGLNLVRLAFGGSLQPESACYQVYLS